MPDIQIIKGLYRAVIKSRSKAGDAWIVQNVEIEHWHHYAVPIEVVDEIEEQLRKAGLTIEMV